MGHFGATHRWGAKFVIHILVIPYLNKMQKVYELRDIPIELC